MLPWLAVACMLQYAAECAGFDCMPLYTLLTVHKRCRMLRYVLSVLSAECAVAAAAVVT